MMQFGAASVRSRSDAALRVIYARAEIRLQTSAERRVAAVGLRSGEEFIGAVRSLLVGLGRRSSPPPPDRVEMGAF